MCIRIMMGTTYLSEHKLLLLSHGEWVGYEEKKSLGHIVIVSSTSWSLYILFCRRRINSMCHSNLNSDQNRICPQQTLSASLPLPLPHVWHANEPVSEYAIFE